MRLGPLIGIDPGLEQSLRVADLPLEAMASAADFAEAERSDFVPESRWLPLPSVSYTEPAVAVSAAEQWLPSAGGDWTAAAVRLAVGVRIAAVRGVAASPTVVELHGSREQRLSLSVRPSAVPPDEPSIL